MVRKQGGGGHAIVLLGLCLVRAMPIFAYCVRTQNVFRVLCGICVHQWQNKVLKRLFACKTDITHANKIYIVQM